MRRSTKPIRTASWNGSKLQNYPNSSSYISSDSRKIHSFWKRIRLSLTFQLSKSEWVHATGRPFIITSQNGTQSNGSLLFFLTETLISVTFWRRKIARNTRTPDTIWLQMWCTMGSPPRAPTVFTYCKNQRDNGMKCRICTSPIFCHRWLLWRRPTFKSMKWLKNKLRVPMTRRIPKRSLAGHLALLFEF